MGYRTPACSLCMREPEQLGVWCQLASVGEPGSYLDMPVQPRTWGSFKRHVKSTVDLGASWGSVCNEIEGYGGK